METSTDRDEIELDNLRDLWSRLRRREIGREAIQFYERFIRPGDLCFDIGANVGVRTAILVETGARVIAVEPQSRCVRILRELFGSHRSVEIVPKGVGEASGTASLHVGAISGIASMSHDWRSAFREWENADATWPATETVELTTLDLLIAEHGTPRYIKIDVEGFELAVLSGLSTVVPMLSFEYHTFQLDQAKRCIEQLQTLGRVDGNYTVEDGMNFVLGEWLSPDELIDKLTTLANKPPWYGDIYVRFIDSDLRILFDEAFGS